MRTLPYAICLLLALPCRATQGDVAVPPQATLSTAASASLAGRQFLESRAQDLRTLVMGPAATEPPPLQPATCETLYRQRLALLRQQTNSRPAWTDDPRNQVATAFGFVSSISFAYLPFTAVQNYLADSRKAGLEARLDQLRQASAGQMCYQR